VKIVYTNLREDDFGVVRSVRQIHLDFNKSEDAKSSLGQSKSRENARRGRLVLVPGSRTQGGLHPEEREWNRDGFTEEEEVVYQPSGIVRSSTQRSLAGFFIRKFVESQTLGANDGRSGSLLNITV
jgi:hypothetical protein